MAEPMSVVARAASIAGLADVSCRLAAALYQSFRAVKEAPKSIQRLSEELGHFHSLLQEVDTVAKSYSTSLSVTKDGMSMDTLQSLLQECQPELFRIQKTVTTFQRKPNKFNNIANNLKWVHDEKTVEAHYRSLERLGRRVDTALSLTGRKNDLATRERDEVLHTQVMEARKDLISSVAETKNLVITHFSTIGNSIEHIASQAASDHAGLQTEIRHGHDSIRQQVSLTERQGCRKLKGLQKDFRDMRSSTRKARLDDRREMLRLDHSIRRLESMLSGLSSLHISSEGVDSSSALVQHSGLEAMMLSLMLMKSSLDDAVSNLRSDAQIKISKDGVDLLLAEYQDLVAFCHEAAAIRIHQRSDGPRAQSEEMQSLPVNKGMSTKYSVAVDSLPVSESGQKYRWCTKSYFSTIGRLTLKFLEQSGDYNSLPTRIVGASFLFIPSLDVQKTGVWASFQKEMKMAEKPSIARQMREIRIAPPATIDAVRHDDLPAIQHMLSNGDLRPWDLDGLCYHNSSRNLIAMAAWHARRRSGAVLNFLLNGGWDLENSEHLQEYIWSNFVDQQTDISEPISLVHSTQDLEPWLQVSRRAFDLGHEFDKHLNYFNDSVMFYLSDQPTMKRMEPEAVRTVVHFLVSHGADIDQEKNSNGETALLYAAHSGGEDSLLWLRVLLEHGADYTVRDFVGRGPLHLTLKKHRTGYEEDGEDPPATSMRLMEAKLVCLIRAGCSIHEVDVLGATPTDFARESCLKIVWENALREVNMLDDKMLELIYKELEHTFPDRDPNFHIHCFDGYKEHRIYLSDEDYYYGPEDFEDWPFDDICEDRDEDMGQEEDEDEDMGQEEDEDEGEAKNEAEQGEANREPEQGLNAHTLSTPELETSTTETPQDGQGSDASSPSPRISGQTVVATGQHHIWM